MTPSRDHAPTARVQKGLSVLLAEDDALQRSALQRGVSLVRPQWRLHVAVSGVDALQYLSSAQVVITDHQMPGMTGAELLRYAKGLPNPPLALLVSGSDEAQAHWDVADLVIRKPVTAVQLIEQVERLLAARRAQLRSIAG